MKRLVVFAVMAMVLCVPFFAKAQSQGIVFIDFQKVMLESEKGKETQRILTGERDRMKKSLDAKQDELRRLKDSLEKQATTMSPDARTEREKQYQNKVKEYERLEQDFSAELRQKNGELTDRILKDIQDIVQGIGAREKYTLILEKSLIVYGSPSVDITAKVISAYNESAKRPAKK